MTRPIALCTLAITLATLPAQETNTLRYRLRPLPEAGQTLLEVEMEAHLSGREHLTFTAPQDRRFGTGDLWKRVSQCTGWGGTELEKTDTGKESYRAVSNEPGVFRIRYRLDYDTPDYASWTYAPNAGPRHVHVAGSQLFLRIDDLRAATIEVGFGDLPEGWSQYSSLGAGAGPWTRQGSLRSSDLALFGAGDLHRRDFATGEGSPVQVFVSRRFDLGPERLATAIETIIRTQRQCFDDHTAPHYSVFVMPREENVAGLAVQGAFVCFFDPHITLDQATRLIAHETLHAWLPGKVEVQPDGSFHRVQWFHEGVTDYLARVILRNAGLLTPQRFAELANLDLLNLADNPHRRESLQELEIAAEEGRFGNAYTKLSYYRGAVMALRWEAELARKGSELNVLGVLRDLLSEARATEGQLTERRFLERLAEHGLDGTQDLERYIVRGEELTPQPDALGDRYTLQTVWRPSYLLGFDLRASQRSGEVTGVLPGSAAAQAGLADGMKLLGTTNTTRFGNAWQASHPVQVRIRTGTGSRSLCFFPTGPLHPVPQFVRGS